MKSFRERMMQKWAVVRVGLVRFAPCHICAVFMAAIASIGLHGRLSPNAYGHLLAGAFWGLLVGTSGVYGSDMGDRLLIRKGLFLVRTK